MAASWGTKKKRESRTAPKSAECEKLELKNDIKPVTVELVPRIPKEELVGSFEEISVPECDVEIKEEADKSDGVSPVLERDPLQIEEHKMAATARNSARSERLTQNTDVSSDGADVRATVCHQLEEDTIKHTHITSYGRSLEGLEHQRNELHWSRHEHSVNNDFTCSTCSEIFSSKYALAMHVCTHTDSVQPPASLCRLCGEVFPTANLLLSHMTVHCSRGETEVRQDETSVESLSESVTSRAEESIYDSSTDIREQAISPCGPSGYNSHVRDISFVPPHRIESHPTDESLPGPTENCLPWPYKCDDCGRCFKHAVHLRQHAVSHTRKKSYDCGECGRSFKQPFHLKQHSLSHTGARPHVCACGKSFSLLGSLRRHAAIHTGEKPHTCDTCFRSFTNAYLLKRHVLVHTGERSYVCGECGNSFKQLVHLKQHAICHTGEKQHKCDVCFKSFTQLGSLRRHAVTHTGQKLFSCDVCLKSFNTGGVLRRHVAEVHEEERLFVCGECGKSFKEVGHLKKHAVLHSGARPHMCPRCGKAFTQSGSLKRHTARPCAGAKARAGGLRLPDHPQEHPPESEGPAACGGQSEGKDSEQNGTGTRIV